MTSEPWKWPARHPELARRLFSVIERIERWNLGADPELRRMDVCVMFGGVPCGELSPDNSGWCPAHKAEFEGIAGDVTALLRDGTPLPWFGWQRPRRERA